MVQEVELHFCSNELRYPCFKTIRTDQKLIVAYSNEQRQRRNHNAVPQL